MSNAIIPAQQTALESFGYQRDITELYDAIQLRVEREAYRLRKKAYYSWRAGKDVVSGPSINLAMAIFRHWPGATLGQPHLAWDDDSVTVTCSCFDHTCKEYVGVHRRTLAREQVRARAERKYSKKVEKFAPHEMLYLQTELDRQDDIDLQIAISKAQRKAILRMAPQWLVDIAMEAAMAGEASTITPEGTKNMVTAFAALGVTQAQLETRLGCKATDITPTQYATLKGVYQGIKDGITTKEEEFPEAEMTIEDLVEGKDAE